MTRVVGDHHQLLDGLLSHEEKLAERRDGDSPGVAASEEGLLEEPLIENDLEADPVLDRCLYEELDDLSWVSLDQSSEDKHQGLDDRWHT